MRGVILAGGTGSRLMPLTKTINKHLLPVCSVPMIYHPLRVLLDNTITEITIVSTPSGIGQLAALLGSGTEFCCEFTYRVQDQPGGIAQALACCESTNEHVAVILGDNIFLPSPTLRPYSAMCFLKEITDDEALRQFGVPVFNGIQIASIEEKPDKPKSDYAVTGLYVFPPCVWERLKEMKRGPRGEFEIMDLLNSYASDQQLSYNFVDGFWRDAGTVEGMRECERLTVR